MISHLLKNIFLSKELKEKKIIFTIPINSWFLIVGISLFKQKKFQEMVTYQYILAKKMTQEKNEKIVFEGLVYLEILYELISSFFMFLFQK